MKQNNKTCICCGEVYTFCTGCGQFDNEPRWRAIYHNETCKDIFIIVSDYLQNAISKEDAKERLLKCDLSYKNKLHEKIQKGIDELLYEEKVAEVMQLTDAPIIAKQDVEKKEIAEAPKQTNYSTPKKYNQQKMKYQNKYKK